jgi:vitamin K-dependent gamma-carboxylase
MRGNAMTHPRAPRSLRDRFICWLEQPQPIERLAFLRIVLPLIILGFLSSRLVHADHWLSPVGFRVPDLGGNDWRQPLYLPPVSPPVAWLIAAVTTLAGISLAAGLFTRMAAGVFTILLAYLALADRLEAFTVSKLAPMLAMVLLLSPSGARYGLDAWRLARRDASAPRPTHLSGGAIRFLQVFLIVMYCSAGVAKLRGGWLSANVLWSHLHSDYQTDFAWLTMRVFPDWAWQVLQVVTLVFEVGAPLWFSLRWTRRIALFAGLGMHAMIGLMFGPVLWFALLMSTLLVGVYAPERWFFSVSATARRAAG